VAFLQDGWGRGPAGRPGLRASPISATGRPRPRQGATCRRLGACALLVGLTSSGCAAATPSPEQAFVPSEAASRALIEFWLVAEGATGVEAVTLGGDAIRLEPGIVASDDDLARPRFTPQGDGWVLDVRFDAQSGVRFDQALLDHHGRQVALLVESVVWRVLDVRPQLGASVVRATSALAVPDADRLRQAIDQRWP